jgi:hypothetical protein
LLQAKNKEKARYAMNKGLLGEGEMITEAGLNE